MTTTDEIGQLESIIAALEEKLAEQKKRADVMAVGLVDRYRDVEALTAQLAERDATIGVLVEKIETCSDVYGKNSFVYRERGETYCQVCNTRWDTEQPATYPTHADDCIVLFVANLPAAAQSYIAERARLEAGQRTPGMVEVCENYLWQSCAWNRTDGGESPCTEPDCPIRAAKESGG